MRSHCPHSHIRKRSAEAVAALRYAGSFESDAAVRNPDRIVGSLLAPRFRTLAGCSRSRSIALLYYRRRYPGAYEYHLARTRFIDETVIREVRDGARQLVILGAGLDTRALRLAEVLRPVRILEVDHPDTSEAKRQRLSHVRGAPANLSLIPADLEGGELLTTLAAAAYDPRVRTLFVCEGVSMFLSAATVTSTLRSIAGAHAQSAVVFDYVLRSVVDGHVDDHLGAARTVRYLARGGEPYRFGLEHEQVEAFVRAHGLALESQLRPADMEHAYLRRSDGTLLGRVSGFHGLALARVRGTPPPGAYRSSHPAEVPTSRPAPPCPSWGE